MLFEGTIEKCSFTLNSEIILLLRKLCVCVQFFLQQVILSENETPEHGQKVAEALMEKLDIAEDDLLATAYADMLTGRC